MSKGGIIIREAHREAWESLPDEQAGKLLKVLLEYQFDAVLPTNLSPELRLAFNFMRPVVDKDRADYQETCRKNAQSSREYWAKNKKEK